ncbi:MAG: aldehyde ferredoxin oxidoreductase family protein [Desulfomonilaceae bacterium]|nr:aldehyde ferredoxin oxidoreductase family protein [Desulfomonilaceae bacterium]
MTTYTGRLLRVDLTSGRTRWETIPSDVQRTFVGGRGFGIHYLWNETTSDVDPLGSENKLLFLPGTLAGTQAQGFGRWIVMTKSPLTGGVARAVGGGNFAAFMKFAGCDLIAIEGKAESPSYLFIDEGGAHVMNAEDLWGLDTEKTQSALEARHGKRVQTACIGPAGERLVRFATITHGTRTASRCGVGTVMGAKNLKAVSISARARPLEAHDPDRFKALVKAHVGILKDHKRVVKLHKFGTTFLAQMTREMGILPFKNFQTANMEGIENLFTESYTDMRVASHGCFNCMTRCGQVHVVKDGPYAGARSEGPEYESIWAFGAQVGNTEVGATVRADNLCDLLGLDTISTGNTVGFAMELFQRGILTTEDTGGMELTWGDHKVMLDLIRMIAMREGFGRVLGEGTRRAAEAIGRGAEKYAMHSKGLEFPAYEPRAAKIHGLSMATSNIGGSHMYGYARQEISGKADPRSIDRFADEGNGDIAGYNQIAKALEETGILCNFADSGMTYELLGNLLAAGTGFKEFQESSCLNLVGERIVCLERCFNVREGFSRKDDTLPERMRSEPLPDAGPATGEMVRNLDGLLDEYYAYMGYDGNGIPTPGKLRELGLDYVEFNEVVR